GLSRRQRNSSGPRRSSRSENRRRTACQRGSPLVERSEKSVSVSVAGVPSIRVHAKRVQRADRPSRRFHIGHVIEQRHLEGNRHARTLQTDAPSERREIAGVGGGKRQGHRDSANRPQYRLLHHPPNSTDDG